METVVRGPKRRLRMAAELLWFASASFGAGLLAAIVAAAVVMVFAQPAYALMFRDTNLVCPLDGEEFRQRIAASGTAHGVMYRAKFSAEEIARLKPYVDSHDYWEMRRRFERLQSMKAFDKGFFREIVELQLKLVSGRDVRPHRAPPKPRATRSAER